jgi:hypothetical protein
MITLEQCRAVRNTHPFGPFVILSDGREIVGHAPEYTCCSPRRTFQLICDLDGKAYRIAMAKAESKASSSHDSENWLLPPLSARAT